MGEWQPVGSVPEDGTVVDLWWQTAWNDSYRVPDCHYRDDETFIDESGNIVDRQFITHWMMPPEPPAQEDRRPITEPDEVSG